MKTILYANTINYNFPLQQRPHHIMNELSKRGWKVIWCDNKKQKNKLRDRINENLTIYYDWDVCKKREQNVDVYFSSWSKRHVDLEDINCKICVYDSLDNFEENSFEEYLMIAQANILFATSNPLYQLRKNEHNNVTICRNACFPELGLHDYDIPDDLKDIKSNGKPVILFSGAVAGCPQNGWVDTELMSEIGKQYNMVIVGNLWGIKEPPANTIFLGSKKYTELQSYYHHCDVNILPFRRCQTSDFSNPIKIYEGLSHGKITVATDIPEATIYPDVVFSSKSRERFLKNINRALTLKNDSKIKEKCYETAKNNSWYNRVDVIETAINDYCRKNSITLG
jgi:hypothetical protein